MLMSAPDAKKAPSRIYINPKFILKNLSSQDPNSLHNYPSLNVMPEINNCPSNPFDFQHWQLNPLLPSQYVSYSSFQNNVPNWNYLLTHPPPPPPESKDVKLFESDQEMAPNFPSEIKEAYRPRKAFINNEKFQSVSEDQKIAFQEAFVPSSSKSVPLEMEFENVHVTSSEGLKTQKNIISSVREKKVYAQRKAYVNDKKFHSSTQEQRRAFQEAQISLMTDPIGQSAVASFKKNSIGQSLLNTSDSINQNRELTINTSKTSKQVRECNYKKEASPGSFSSMRQNLSGRGVNTRYKIVKRDSKLLAKTPQVQTTLTSACHPLIAESRYKLVRKDKLVPKANRIMTKVNCPSDGQFEEASTKIASIPLLGYNPHNNLLSKYRLVNTSSLKSEKSLKEIKLITTPKVVKSLGNKNSIIKSSPTCKIERKKVFSASQELPMDTKKTKLSMSKYKIVHTPQKMPLNIKRHISSISKYQIVRTTQRKSTVSKKSPNFLSVISRYKMIRPTIKPHLSAFKKDLAHRSRQLKSFHKYPKLINKGSLRYSISHTRLGRISVPQSNLAEGSRQMSNKMIRKGNVLYSVSARQLKRLKSVDTPKSTQVNSSIAVVTRAKNRSLATLSSLKKKGTLPCMFLAKFGKCSKQERNQCPYSHSVSKTEAKRMRPTCQFFLEGRCRLGKECPFPHVKHGSHTPICLSFISGKCLLGDKCSRRHENICVEFKSTGKCSQVHKCPLKHMKITRKPKRRIVRTQKQESISAERYFDRSDKKNEDKLSSELISMRARLLKKIQVMKGEIIQVHSMPGAAIKTDAEEDTSRPSLGALPDFISID